jgi:hypothetical protein
MYRTARRIVKSLLDDHVIKTLLPHLPGKTSYDLDLIFADMRPDVEILIAKRLEEVAEAARGHVDG